MSFISYLKDGISLGSIYAIIALGYTMVYGIAKMLNFAHGDVIMVGAYIILTCITRGGMSPILAVILSVVICTLLGVVIEKVAYSPLRKASSNLAVLITAIGVSYLLQNLALLIFGADAKSFVAVIKVPSITLFDGELTIKGITIVTILACIIIMVGLSLFVKKTKPGRAMQAVSEDRDAAQLMGVNVNFPHICHRFRTCSDRRPSALSDLSDTDSVHRSHAWYQSFRSCCIRWNRFDSGSYGRRHPSGNHRDLRKSLYFFPGCRCDRICSPDRRASCKTYRTVRQEHPGESVRWPI